ncbi:uncharacterized protein AAES06_000765 isoform 1-T2 [Glossophaga mutica]
MALAVKGGCIVLNPGHKGGRVRCRLCALVTPPGRTQSALKLASSTPGSKFHEPPGSLKSCLGNFVEPGLQLELLNHFHHRSDSGGTRRGACESWAGWKLEMEDQQAARLGHCPPTFPFFGSGPAPVPTPLIPVPFKPRAP